MKLEILLSCMHGDPEALIRSSHITGNAVIINQCDEDGFAQIGTENGTVRIYRTTQRGLTRSRNMAIAHADSDICLLCDDDEVFVPDYEARICRAYEENPEADVIILKMVGREPSFPDRTMRLRFPKTIKVSSWQISFRIDAIRKSGVRFDPLLGAGSGNGAEEELDFLLKCERVGLRIVYVPVEIASVAQSESTWFRGFTERFFYDRGATTRYILGYPLAAAYALYYIVRKRKMYRADIAPHKALRAIFCGIFDNKIGKMAQKRGKDQQI